ncbi:TIGR04222 domain-containing membrane protein [Streptomyces sp. NPDC027717]|uniref:TIGR04222 domain-containing membrane protein n=1 Tax=Streptomyces sp. NPDC027717 TaxID=3155765 RepID=UPI0033D15775
MFWVLLLLPAWAFAAIACTRLCLAAARAASADSAARGGGQDRDLTLYETAFLSGGPSRVADLAMVRMARQRRLLLAHTGWATVVDPRGRDEMERSVIGAIGPQGQSRIAPVRAAAAGAEAVQRLAERLVGAGLAVPFDTGTTVAAGVRQVRAAAVAVLALGVTALLMPVPVDLPRLQIAMWFALPLVVTLSCLAIARVEVHPYPRWASPAGQRLLGELARRPAGDGDEGSLLTRLAMRGVRALNEPELRAAFTHRDAPGAHGEH